MKFRTERERLIVVWGGIIGFLLLWSGLFVQPALKNIQRLQTHDIRIAQENLDHARELAGELAKYPDKPPQPVNVTSIAGQLDAIVRQQLHIPQDHIRTVKDVGKGAQIELTSLDGGTIIKLLHALNQANIHPETADFNNLGRTEALWDTTLTINAGTP